MAWGGVTPAELQRIAAEDNRWEEAYIIVPSRRKGRGAPGRIVPLGPEGVEAFKDLALRRAYGRFRVRAVLRAWQRACRRALGRHVRLYDLRHSYVTAILRATKNLDTARLLAGHKDARTTQRYALAAIVGTLRVGVDATFPEKEKPS